MTNENDLKRGYATKHFDQPVKRYVRTMDLQDNPELWEKYRLMHSEGHIWKEILAGIREVGILEMEIYILGKRLVMVMDTVADFDFDRDMARCGELPRQREWEEFMASFQQCDPNSAATERWQLMERMFYLYE